MIQGAFTGQALRWEKGSARTDLWRVYKDGPARLRGPSFNLVQRQIDLVEFEGLFNKGGGFSIRLDQR
jgi:hypothetical protein